MTFPVVSYRDSVRVHKALVDSLGVKRLHAVIGASGGSIQAMEWGAQYPGFVERVIHVIGPGLDIDGMHLLAAEIQQLRRRRTVVIATHMPGLMRSADQIYVMNESELVEVGSHDELADRPNGLYRSLVAKGNL